MNPRSVLFVASVTALTFAEGALAQGKTEPSYRVQGGDSGSYEVAFDDDALLDPGKSAYGEWIGVRPPAKRAGLIRPRVSFVPEMLKSVQGL